MSKKQTNIIDIQKRMGVSITIDQLETLFTIPETDFIDVEIFLDDARDLHTDDALIQELCRRIIQRQTNTSYAVWALEEIGGQTTVQALFQILEDPELSPRVKADASYVLTALGQPLPEAHFNPLQEPDVKDILDQTANILKDLPSEERAYALADLLFSVIQHIDIKNQISMYEAMVAGLQASEHPLAVDLIWVVGYFAPEEPIRQTARQAIIKMQREPNPDMVNGTLKGRFLNAYLSIDQDPSPNQGQLLVLWEQPSGSRILFSFMRDFRFWGGGLKKFFVAPGLSQEEIDNMLFQSGMLDMLETTEIGLEETQNQIQNALQANATNQRPIPAEYRFYHTLMSHLLFQNDQPIPLPHPETDMQSPLSGKAAQVENLLVQKMPEAAYKTEQITNARMLWRDFYLSSKPTIRKPEVWAGVIEYIIGHLELRTEQTQQAIAERYDISAATISNRYYDVWHGFLHREADPIAYQTEKVQQMADPFDMLNEMLDDEDLFDFFDEPDVPDYEDYLEVYQKRGKGRPKLTEEAFEELFLELDDLYEHSEYDDLTKKQERRMEELERLLLLDDF